MNSRFNFSHEEIIRKDEMALIISLKKKHLNKLIEIKNSKKCLGDKIRTIVNLGITNNATYAAKLYEMV